MKNKAKKQNDGIEDFKELKDYIVPNQQTGTLKGSGANEFKDL